MIFAALAVLESQEQRNELAKFYEENKNRLFAIAYEHLHNKEDAEDAIQETFLRIANKPYLFFSKNQKDRVLYTIVIVRNISVDIYHKKQKHKCEDLTDDIVDKCIPVIERAVGERSKEELMAFIRSLSEALRQALFLKIHYQMTTSEIAKSLDISETAARKRISDAEKRIRQYMEDKENE